jgi:hypothetical protein
MRKQRDADRLRGTAEHLRSRAAAAVVQPVRAQLLALADYYDGMAEDIEAPAAVAHRHL